MMYFWNGFRLPLIIEMVVLVRVIVEGLDAAGGGGEVLQAAERGTNEGSIKR